MTLRILLLALAVLVTNSFADPHQERRWTGVNGKTFRGAYMGTDQATGKYSFALEGGKSYLIAPSNLSKEDLEWLDLELHPEKKKRPTVGDPDDFLPDPNFNRTIFPTVNQADYGSKASDCVPSSFCNFLLWWDQEKFLPINKKGGFDKKAEYIHTRIARYFDTRNTSGTSMRDAEEGVRTYFERDLKELATFRILTDYDCSPDNLRRYAQGGNATLLGMNVYYGRKQQSSHVVALSHVEDNGDIVFHTWGTRIRGRLTVLEKDVRLPEATTAYTGHKYKVEIMNPADQPEWIIDNDVSFQINPRSYDGLFVVAPYRYKTPGAALPPPPHPVMQPGDPKKPERPKPKPVVFPRLSPPPLPHEFQKPATYQREWTFTDGSTLKGWIVSHDDDAIVISADGKRHTKPVDELSPADRARALLWSGLNGPAAKVNDAKFEYLLTRGTNYSETATIFVSGPRFRLETGKENRKLVANVETGEFIVHWDKKKNYIGRLDDLVRLPPPPKDSDLTPWESLRDSIPSAPPSTHPDWPCRALAWPGPAMEGETNFLQPALQFSGLDCPPLQTALKIFFAPTSSSLEGKDKKSYYGIMKGPMLRAEHHGANPYIGFLHQARLAPVLIQWTNVVDHRTSQQSWKERSKLKAGTFRLELKNLTLEPQPESLFKIPADAAKVDPGHHRQIAPQP